MNADAAVTEVEIWSRTIRPEVGDLSTATARDLLRLQLSAADADRVRELSARANEGTLSPAEADELDHYLNVGRALEFLKTKARLSLNAAA